MTKLTKLRQMADRLYEIAEDGASDLDRTAAEVEAEMHVYLQGQLMSLLELFESASVVLPHVNEPFKKQMREELAKWKR